ncbi:MAG: PAAR-like domain-containing protein [Polyangiaceae bacterium]
MLLAINRGVGMSMGMPDVCLTPAGPAAVPVPYPNIALHVMTLGFSPNVLLSGLNALNLMSVIPITLGHSPGVLHPLYMQQARFVTGSPVVFVNALPGIHHCALGIGNLGNAAVCSALVPSMTNVFYTYDGARAVAATPSDAEDLSTAGACPTAMDLAPAARAAGPSLTATLETDGVAAVRIERFSIDVPARMACAVRELSTRGLRAMRLDLRGNPGGEFLSFVELASDFLPFGALIARCVDEEGDVLEHRASTERPYDFPLEILVDGLTASAAELFAEALCAHGRAAITGGPTFGKRVAQRIVVVVAAGALTETVEDALTIEVPS